MPRKRQTQAGQPAQPVGPVAGQEYGMGAEQMQLQQQMPAPQVTSTRTIMPPAQAVSQIPGAAAAQPDADAMAAIIQAMRGKAGLLKGGTSRPTEPVTAGLATGPGPGPEVLGLPQGNPTGMTMRNLSRLTGDPYFDDLAARAGM